MRSLQDRPRLAPVCATTGMSAIARVSGTLFAAFLAVTCAALVAYTSSTVLVLAGVAVLTAVQWGMLHRASGQPVPLPGIAVLGLNVVGVLGWLYYRGIAEQ